jgi:hypothetical protein
MSPASLRLPGWSWLQPLFKSFSNPVAATEGVLSDGSEARFSKSHAGVPFKALSVLGSAA